MKDLAINIASRSLILLNVLIVFNFVYEGTFWSHDIRHQSEFITDVWAVQDTADILFLGDCSDAFYRDQDESYLGISDYLNMRLPDQQVAAVSQSGFHGGVYHKLLQNVSDSASIKTVVVTLNMRAFTAPIIWSKNENQLNKRMVMLEDRPPLVNRFMLSFQGYTVLSEDERLERIQTSWETDSLHNDNLPFATLWQWFDSTRTGAWNPAGKPIAPQDRELAALYIQNYSFSIDTAANPMIAHYDAICELAQERGWNLLFLLVPDNLQKAELYGGPELRKMVEQKHDLLTHRYTTKGAVVMRSQLESWEDLFVEPNPNSHYKAWGRYTLGYETADKMKEAGWVERVQSIALPQ